MQTEEYIPIGLEPSFMEVYIDLSKLVSKDDAIESVSIFRIEKRDKDFREKKFKAGGYVRYALPSQRGVIVGFEPWTILRAFRFVLNFKTTNGLVGKLYYEAFPRISWRRKRGKRKALDTKKRKQARNRS